MSLLKEIRLKIDQYEGIFSRPEAELLADTAWQVNEGGAFGRDRYFRSAVQDTARGSFYKVGSTTDRYGAERKQARIKVTIRLVTFPVVFNWQVFL